MMKSDLKHALAENKQFEEQIKIQSITISKCSKSGNSLSSKIKAQEEYLQRTKLMLDDSTIKYAPALIQPKEIKSDCNCSEKEA